MPTTNFPGVAPGQLYNRPEFIELRNEWLEKRGLEVGDFPGQILDVGSGPDLLREYGMAPGFDKGRPYLILTFNDPTGNFYVSEVNGKPRPFIQARFLGDPKPGMIRPGDDPPPKVLTPAGRGVEAHYALPKGYPHTWQTLPEDEVVFIVESMPKALAVAKALKKPTIGLCGVRSFSSTKQDREFILAGMGIDLTKQFVYILFDANWAVNEDILRAQESLASKLKYTMGVEHVYICKLPPVPSHGENKYKAGPDDYIVEFGADALGEVVLAAEEFKSDIHQSLVEELNERAYFIEEGVKVVDRKSKNVNDTYKAAELYRPIGKDVPGKRGQNPKRISGFTEWMQSKSRNQVDKLGYRYLANELYDHNGLKYYNLYRRDGIWEEGPVDEEGGERLHVFMKNMLGPKLGLILSQMRFVKYTNKIPQTFTLFVSDVRGVGKTLIMEILESIMGPHNSNRVSNDEFQGKFNSGFASKRFIYVNELTVEERRKPEVAARLKELVGSSSIVMEAKGVDTQVREMSMMLWMSTNTVANIPVDTAADRRMDVVNCITPEDNSPAYWDPIWEVASNPAALRYLLVKYIKEAEWVDFSSRRADYDADKADVVHASRDPMHNAIDEAREAFKEEGVNCVDIATFTDYLDHVMNKSSKTPNAEVSAALRAMGWRPYEKAFRPTKKDFARPVYVVDKEKFEPDATSVQASIAIARKMIPASKY